MIRLMTQSLKSKIIKIEVLEGEWTRDKKFI
jgi:hypothetical protein